MTRAEAFLSASGGAEGVCMERFGPPPRAVSATSGLDVELTLARAGRRVSGMGGTSLLEQLEAAGERPAHGCRMGICRTCRCKKLSGVVENVLTGTLSGPGEQEIPLCVSIPRGDVTLDL